MKKNKEEVPLLYVQAGHKADNLQEGCVTMGIDRWAHGMT